MVKLKLREVKLKAIQLAMSRGRTQAHTNSKVNVFP